MGPASSTPPRPGDTEVHARRRALPWDYRPGVSTASWEVTGMLYRGGVPRQRSARSAHLESAPQAEKILGPKQPFSMDFALESEETDQLGRTACRTPTRDSCRPLGCLLLLLLPRLLLPVGQQPCSRASGLHDVPAATRTNVHDALAALQDVRRRCSACCSVCPARQRRPAPRSGALW